MKHAISTYSVLVAFFVIVAVVSACSDSRSEIEQRLNDEYRGHILTLRNFQPGKMLEFDSNGNPLQKAPTDSWTLSAEIEVERVNLEESRLVVQGQRVFLVYDQDGFRSLFPLVGNAAEDGIQPPAKKTRPKMKEWEKQRKVEVRISLPSTDKAEEATRAVIGKVFLRRDEHMSDIVPAAWTDIVRQLERGDSTVAPSAVKTESRPEKPLKAGKGVSPPRASFAPDPEYTEIARKAKYQGTVVLWVVVGPDGNPRDIRIARGLGLGLDDKAVESVSRWRFEPAMKEGQPVAVQINVEVNFRLY